MWADIGNLARVRQKPRNRPKVLPGKQGQTKDPGFFLAEVVGGGKRRPDTHLRTLISGEAKRVVLDRRKGSERESGVLR